MTTWIPDETIWDCDTIADGCPEASKVYSRRFHTADPTDGMYGVVTIQFYCHDRWEKFGEDVSIDEVYLKDPPPAEERYTIGRVVEFVVCPDFEWPDEGATITEYTYKDAWFARAEKFTDEQIKALMENYKTEWIYWDGLSDSMDVDVQSTWAEPVEAVDWDERVPVLTEELLGWVFLMEAFREELCHECMQDADGHIAKRDMFNKWHAWCKIQDPAYALQVLRERIEQADTTKHENGFSDEDVRAQQFEAAFGALVEAGVLKMDPDLVVAMRKDAASDDHLLATLGQEALTNLFARIASRLPKAT